MGLKHVAGQDTYGVISKFSIYNDAKMVDMTLDVYDSTKTTLLFSRNFGLNCAQTHPSVKSVSKTKLDGNEKDNEEFYVPIGAEGDLAPFAGKIIALKGKKPVVTKTVAATSIIEDENGIVYQLDAQLRPIKTTIGSSTVWAKYFESEVAAKDGTNYLKQAYAYIKDVGLYPSAVDA